MCQWRIPKAFGQVTYGLIILVIQIVFQTVKTHLGQILHEEQIHCSENGRNDTVRKIAASGAHEFATLVKRVGINFWNASSFWSRKTLKVTTRKSRNCEVQTKGRFVFVIVIVGIAASLHFEGSAVSSLFCVFQKTFNQLLLIIIWHGLESTKW